MFNIFSGDSAATIMTLDKEVYEGYAKDAPNQNEYKELENGFSYKEEDGTVDTFYPVGDNAYLMISVKDGYDSGDICSRISAEPNPEGNNDLGDSELYSQEELEEGAMMILDEFGKWNGCELQNIEYAGDECNSEENLKWLNDIGDGKKYTQCAEFLMDFHSPTEEKDLEGTAWEPDKDYLDYQWWLAREEGGTWEVVSTGY